jgi:uncharacterized protein with FMN-binding domain
METTKKLHPGVSALIIIVLIGVVATAVIVINNSDSTVMTRTSTSGVSNAPSTDTSTYADGTYSATGSYSSPGGRESIDLTVTIKDGIITSTEVTTNPAGRDSRAYQEAFASGYKELVVGKDVKEVSLSRVAGSSLTSNGFDDALDQIKADARV